MTISLSVNLSQPLTLLPSKEKRCPNKSRYDSLLEPLKHSKDALIPPYMSMKGVDPNKGNVFDTFKRIDDVTREINFVHTQDEWDATLEDEVLEFQEARAEYYKDPSQKNYEHMAEEMGDIFYTAASLAKDIGIDPEKSFKGTTRKFFNRINLMERMLNNNNGYDKNLRDCTDEQRRSLWQAAKKEIYKAQDFQYMA